MEKFTFKRAYGATFKIGNFDFTLVLVHTIYGNNESQRKAENFKMVDDVWLFPR